MDSFWFAGPVNEGQISRKGAVIVINTITPNNELTRKVKVFGSVKGAKREYRARLKGARKQPDYFVDENS